LASERGCDVRGGRGRETQRGGKVRETEEEGKGHGEREREGGSETQPKIS
jgi:hypothetical protein